MSDSLSMAFLVLLESLTPTERAVFLLHEVFGYDYKEIARHHRQVRDELPPDPDPGPPSRRRRQAALRRFPRAARGSGPPVLRRRRGRRHGPPCSRWLAPDVVMVGDGGGKAWAIAQPLSGAEQVVRLVLGLYRRAPKMGVHIEPAWVNGQPGGISYDGEGRVVNVFVLDIADGLVQTVRSIVNPDKLHHLGPVSDVALRAPRDLTCRPWPPRFTEETAADAVVDSFAKTPDPRLRELLSEPGQAPARVRQGNRAHHRRMGAGDRLPHRDGAEMRRRTAGIHPALRRPRRLHAGGDDQQQEDGRGDGIHRARPVPHDRVPPPGTRRVHRLRRRPARRAWSLAGSSPADGTAARAPNSMSGRPTTRASTTSSSRACSPGPTAAACSPADAGRRLLVPHGRAEPLPDPDRRPGRRRC